MLATVSHRASPPLLVYLGSARSTFGFWHFCARASARGGGAASVRFASSFSRLPASAQNEARWLLHFGVRALAQGGGYTGDCFAPSILVRHSQATWAPRPSSLCIDGCCLGVHARVELRHTLLRSPLAHPTGSRAGRTRSLPAGPEARAGGGCDCHSGWTTEGDVQAPQAPKRVCGFRASPTRLPRLSTEHMGLPSLLCACSGARR